MHEVIIQIPDDAYATAEKRARQEGFENTETYLSGLLLINITTDDGDVDHLFTPSVLAAIEKGANEARSGKGMTRDEVDAFLAIRRTEWLQNTEG